MPVKSKVKISQNVVAFSEYMNFINKSADLAEDTCGTTNHLVLNQEEEPKFQFIINFVFMW